MDVLDDDREGQHEDAHQQEETIADPVGQEDLVRHGEFVLAGSSRSLYWDENNKTRLLSENISLLTRLPISLFFFPYYPEKHPVRRPASLSRFFFVSCIARVFSKEKKEKKETVVKERV